MGSRGRLVAALACALILLASFGDFISDERYQAVAFHNLAEGRLRITEQPGQIFRDGPGLGDVDPSRYNGTAPVASTALNVAGLPLLALVRVVDAAVPISYVLAGAAVGLGFVAVGGPSRWPAWSTARKRVVAGTLAGTVLALTLGFGGPSPALPYNQAKVALGLTNAALYCTTVWLLFPLVERRSGPGLATAVALLAVALGPLMFWGFKLKYHALAALLFTAVLYAADQAPGRRRDAALGALVGLLVWTNIGAGAVVALAVGAWYLAGLGTNRSQGGHHLRASFWALTGLALGLAPALVENWYLFGDPTLPFYFAREGQPIYTPPMPWDIPTTASSSASISLALSPVEGLGVASALAQSWTGHVWEAFQLVLAWEGPGDFFRNLAATYVWGQAEGDPIPVLLLSPLLAAAFVGLGRLRRRPRDPTLVLCALAWAAQTVLFTNHGVRQGAGWDMRFYTLVLPPWALLAAGPIGAMVRRATSNSISEGEWLRRFAAMTLGWGLVFLLVQWALVHALPGRHVAVYDYELLRALLLAMVGVAVCVVAFAMAWGLVRGLRPARVATLALALALATPAIWTASIALRYPGFVPLEEEPGAVTMYVPAMTVVADAYREHFFPEPPQSRIFHNGQIVFDPVYGDCTQVPSPCPPEILALPPPGSSTAASGA